MCRWIWVEPPPPICQRIHTRESARVFQFDIQPDTHVPPSLHTTPQRGCVKKKKKKKWWEHLIRAPRGLDNRLFVLKSEVLSPSVCVCLDSIWGSDSSHLALHGPTASSSASSRHQRECRSHLPSFPPTPPPMGLTPSLSLCLSEQMDSRLEAKWWPPSLLV